MTKTVQGFPKYEITDTGEVRNKKTGKVLKQSFKESKGSGYFYVFLYNEKGRKTFLVHRLVAQAFHPNPENLPQVNHIDENTKNNNASNLEWCSAKYNANYGNHTKHCQETLKKSGKGWLGRRHREESRIKISLAKKGIPSKKRKPVLINGTTRANSLSECAQMLKISLTQAHNLIFGIRKSDKITLSYLED